MHLATVFMKLYYLIQKMFPGMLTESVLPMNPPEFLKKLAFRDNPIQAKFNPYHDIAQKYITSNSVLYI